MSKTGVIYLKVRLELEHDVCEHEAEELVNELDYEFNDAGKRIQNQEIVGFGTSYDME